MSTTTAVPTSTAVPSFRLSPDNATVLKQLGLLAELAGVWRGQGFNLIARPDFHDKTDLYLQLNQTRETLTLEPIGSPIPNRGFGQDDIELFGLTYLQQISDAGNDGALHIEPGIWATQPPTSFPSEADPAGGQIVARMGNIPHGNSILVQGVATPFVGTPVLSVPGVPYNFSLFPSFNTTPFGVPPAAPAIVFNAAGSSEALTAPTLPAAPFPQYDLSVPVGPIPPGPKNPPFTLNTRTPFNTEPPEPQLPASLKGVPIQDVVNDPIRLLQADVQELVNLGFEFEGVVINIASTASVTFRANPNTGPTSPTVAVSIPQFGGGIQNIPFLVGEQTAAGPEENAQTAVVYATFWIEKALHRATGRIVTQLQYAQMVVLNFPVFHLLQQTPPVFVNLGWPHVSVGTLRKSFN